MPESFDFLMTFTACAFGARKVGIVPRPMAVWALVAWALGGRHVDLSRRAPQVSQQAAAGRNP